MRHLLPLLALLLLLTAASAQEGPNLLTNADFSAGLGEDGNPVGWAWWKAGGEPGFGFVKDPEGDYLQVTLPDRASNARMSQGLKLPANSYYRATLECRAIADAGVAPELALRIAFPTPRGLWRIWAYTDPALEGEWQTLSLEFLVPNENEPGDMKLHIGNNGETGRIDIRSASLVELPLSDWQRENAHVTGEGHIYFPKHAAPPAAPEYSEELREAGLFWWQPADHDGVTPWDAHEEPLERLEMSVPAGSRASAVVVLEATRDLTGIRLRTPHSLSGFGWDVGVSHLRVWRQRDGHHGGFYHDIPELLEPLPETVDLKAGERLQLLIALHSNRRNRETPALSFEAFTEAGDGAGAARASFDLVGQSSTEFLAPSPEGIVWGLYPDPGHWLSYTDKQLQDELLWLRDCGINSMLLYVLSALTLPETLTDANLDAALADWRASLEEWSARYIAPLYALGYGPTLVANVQSLDTALARPMGEEVVVDGAYNPHVLEYERRFLQVLEDLRIERGWPEFTWHVIDEPGSGLNPIALAEFGLLKEMGLRAFSTANKPSAVRDFADLLDDFCASSGVFGNPDEAARAHEWLAHRDDARLWLYGGAGTYTGQEGTMAANRWGTGFLVWRNGTTGQFYWTFQRVTGSSFDDFDGKRGKDFCLTYPDPAGGASLSTLQWEGICEGIVDYRHLVTLEAEIVRAREDGRADVANRVAGELEALRAELWAQEERPTNRMLDDWRERVAGWIAELAG